MNETRGILVVDRGMACLYYKVALISVFAIEETNSVSYRLVFPGTGIKEVWEAQHATLP